MSELPNSPFPYRPEEQGVLPLDGHLEDLTMRSAVSGGDLSGLGTPVSVRHLSRWLEKDLGRRPLGDIGPEPEWGTFVDLAKAPC